MIFIAVIKHSLEVIVRVFYNVTIMTLQCVATVLMLTELTECVFLIVSGFLADRWTLHKGIWEASVVLWQSNRHEITNKTFKHLNYICTFKKHSQQETFIAANKGHTGP